jgi:hypothetical protein
MQIASTAYEELRQSAGGSSYFEPSCYQQEQLCEGKTVNSTNSDWTKEVLDELSPEDIEKRKNAQIHNCCDFKIKTMAWVFIVEGIQHHMLDRPGSPF